MKDLELVWKIIFVMSALCGVALAAWGIIAGAWHLLVMAWMAAMICFAIYLERKDLADDGDIYR